MWLASPYSLYPLLQTIFELNVGSKAQSAAIMKEKRRQHEARIRELQEEKAKKKQALSEDQENDKHTDNPSTEQADETAIVRSSCHFYE